MRPRSIRARLTLWYTSLLTVTVLVLGGTAYGLLGYSLAQDVDKALQGVAQVVAERSRGGQASLVPGDIDSLFRQFFGLSPWDRYVERRYPWGDRDRREPAPHAGGVPMSADAMRRAAKGLPTFETVEGLGRYPVRVMTHPVVEADRVTSVIQVGMSLESVSVAQRRFLLVMATLLPLMLLLAGGGGWLLARRALRPVDRMSAAARRISAEHLNARLDSSGSGDELDRLAQTLNDMLGRLDAGFRQIRQFSADASHELQTPLTILKGELEVALRAPRSAAEYQRVLASALEECEQLTHLVEGLLLLARADAGVLRIDHQPVDLAHLVAEIDEQVGILADTHAVSLCLGPVEALTTVGDREHLRRLLLNLIDNSIKYTPPGGRITLALEQEDGWAALQVSDTGIGLSLEEQERIFQRFYRSTNTHLPDEGGSGLGLCIAQSIAEAHGGHIRVDSIPGRGSTFTVLLPLYT
jgi:two-component system, OmpR family, sensor kinase